MLWLYVLLKRSQGLQLALRLSHFDFDAFFDTLRFTFDTSPFDFDTSPFDFDASILRLFEVY